MNREGLNVEDDTNGDSATSGTELQSGEVVEVAFLRVVEKKRVSTLPQDGVWFLFLILCLPRPGLPAVPSPLVRCKNRHGCRKNEQPYGCQRMKDIVGLDDGAA